ncbi:MULTISPECIES: hypothetical protein [Chryseobacterium]|uniref:hypothetical protein n=1 Tax=Chryseobacterium TaxID=59732 RepID=UPI00192D5595|nr:hypothetical protein [Chryseobacterium cucumeris]QRA42156.1 hypothetical protein JNG87_16205 [Chryseobacterium cucumeris]
MKQLSERALNFLKRKERKEEFYIDKKEIENYLSLYSIKNYSEILRFQEMYSGLIINDNIIHIFNPANVKEHKTIKTFLCEEQVLFPICNGLCISEDGRIAIKDNISNDYIFYFEFFETFIEQQAFFEEYQDYKHLPAIGYYTKNISLISKGLADYDFITECSDRYHSLWKNISNLVHARLYPGGYTIIFDSISEKERSFLIKKLESNKLI